MQISQTISDFTGAVEAVRNALATVTQKIELLQAERRAIVNAPPHTDDIIALYLRGLDAGAADFKRQFASYLSDTFKAADGSAASAVAMGRSANILRLEATKPDTELLKTRSMTGKEAPFNIAILAYFLHDRIAGELAQLVDELFPAARNGMKASERADRLRELDADLADLKVEQERLQEELSAARAAVMPRG